MTDTAPHRPTLTPTNLGTGNDTKPYYVEYITKRRQHCRKRFVSRSAQRRFIESAPVSIVILSHN